VMHGMDDTVDMRRYGGLSTFMKITWATFGLGWLAILGVPPFSGFWSKDKIIEAAFSTAHGEGWQPWVFGTVALVGAGITAFYMSRLFFMTFHGEKRWNDGHGGGATDPAAPTRHPHESPRLMTWPMIVLSLGSVALGGVLAAGNVFTQWLEPVTGPLEEHEPVVPVAVIMALTLLLVVAGAFLAWRQYAASPVAVVPPAGSALTRAARKDLYQDEVNDAVLVLPGQVLTRSLVFGDRQVVDGAATGLAKAVAGSGEVLRRVQNGFVRSYAATMLAGIVVLIAIAQAFRI
ncbi:MAG: NADH-quinone oxidoreductase subunit L, partial [Cellulomonadaceae bacterium]|nr:NADH-quinone oxidoreductase subunit L [Cellulomonadaceae bacterium]